MTALLVGLGLWIVGGVAGLFGGRRQPAVSAALAVVGSALGLGAAAHVLQTGAPESFRAAWPMPYGEIHMAVDPLSAVFLAPIFLLGALASVYSIGYLHGRDDRQVGRAVFLFHLLAVSMCVVVCVKNAILFLLAWEMMAISSFLLVLLDSRQSEVRHAGWMYLVATHIGTAFILVLFAWMGTVAGSFDFDDWRSLPSSSESRAGAWFVLALIGFGAKAGFWPVHVWLPEAHPAAPSHVSAVMSGVMIKTGIYGLVRVVTFLGPPPAWWGMALLSAGLVSGVLGVLFALAQHDVKRLLAYHSVENIGIIALGLGGALLGQAYGMEEAAVFGLAGALLHVVNHALFKGLLFMGAGSVLHATGTRDVEKLGGLLKQMPATGTTFLIGSASISGLPPLNGFVSEFLIYVCFFKLALGGPAVCGAAGAAAIAGLALIGGLAAACFTKVFGVMFLGERRTPLAASEAPLSMTAPMAVLAAACILIGLFPAVSASVLIFPVLASETDHLLSMTSVLTWVQLSAAVLVGLGIAVIFFRAWIFRGRPVSRAVTWDCGYSAPTSRMQYTASSFVQPFIDLFQPLIQPRERRHDPHGYFPKAASYESHADDLATRGIFGPLFGWIQTFAEKWLWIQQGRVQTYLLYVFLTLAALLSFQMFQ
ncbi:hydrogenase [bacterium]|nr:hydrogenase [bacterium]